MYTFEQLLETFEKEIKALPLEKEPKLLYEPIRYLLEAGGKRVRPVMSLMAHNLFDDDISKSINVAIAIELFHNFTLLHDDIMDNAMIRRGRPTANNKWNNSVAILSGDTMSIMAYSYLIKTSATHLPKVLSIFNKFSIEICEGQRYDMDYEDMHTVSKQQYIEMIRLKTSVLLASAMEIGAVTGGADEQTAKKLYDFGECLGLAFQLTDDMLDTYGNEKTFGKKIGGDIMEGKKTFLYISTLLNAPEDKHKEIIELFHSSYMSREDKVRCVRECYDNYNAKEALDCEIEGYYKKSMAILDSIDVEEEKKSELRKFAKRLIEREN